MVDAVVKDGKIVDTRSEALSDSTQKAGPSGSLDKEAFLQLLVAQMQYQDPLEPMDNTEYVSQLATFSELEAMNNLNDSMDFYRASQLVGKNVLVRTTSKTTGETYMTQGVVDYVTYENGKAYLVIGEKPFSIDDLDTVISDEYWEKHKNDINNTPTESAEAVKNVLVQIAKLPDENNVTAEHEKAIKAAREAYDKLTDDEKKLVDPEALYYLIRAEGALAKILADKPQQGGTEDDKTEGEGSEEGSEGAAGEGKTESVEA